MPKLGISIALLLFSINTFAKTDIELVYSGLRFKIPGNFSVIGDTGGSQNILIFRYGDELGKRFLAFSDMTDDETLDYGCPASSFFMNVFFGTDDSGCDQDSINIMQEYFVEGREVEKWSENELSVVYSGNREKSYVFIIGDNGKLVKLDSDFLEKESLKKIVSGI
ncbi:hypothetical protein [Billgrantia aerodenitrificans]|uniref:Uncharacterized protein n=1 Tax=Billgrantia aerodenitrificans TaxID=2733483 RepID=A0ABS9AUC9_9GAMM|nr:hypothetical protein [Halomonas aerodenitrificans]MCE8025237.1 hypothetical protein [Halomonas aerodenitrificans]